ncbi:PPC domain-containing DNA-binding protein [Desulfosoma caldarium]|uniref:Putative DNA-binding protein with PD1-like motif n=1 Tax=Desulfosoma caldarium TaxID=610254 RepID=A0A3N1UQE6_9BACT|nr:PPC domain-containing DNA-binding protein [Desulfosoma caldarium]ROQ93342.1 putative DNA-binding protein with PD1-like motif [Desulfosoma caldarium]
MRYDEGQVGRVFVLRLEEGERIPEVIETFAREKGVQRAMAILLGGIDDGSRVVVGPEAGRGREIVPLVHTLSGIQEILAVGTLFPDENGNPVLHMHGASGREGGASVGCTRAGVTVWLVGEVILLEILGSRAVRTKDASSGLTLLTL